MKAPDSNPIQRIARDLWLERLAAGHPGVLTVISGSMSPMLRLGDRIRVRKGGKFHPPGSLVVFMRDGDFVCHRVMWWIHPGRYLQKGDLDSRWESIRSHEIIGIATEIVMDNTAAPLYGRAYRFHNICIWMLVAIRFIFWQEFQFKGNARTLLADLGSDRRTYSRYSEFWGRLMAETAEKKIPQRNADLTWRDENGDVFICSPDGENLYALTEVGADLWRACDGNRTLEEIESELLSIYDVRPETLHSDLDAFLEKMVKAELITLD